MPRNDHPAEIMIESLESRIAPATFVVTNLADAGAGSLREAPWPMTHRARTLSFSKRG